MSTSSSISSTPSIPTSASSTTTTVSSGNHQHHQHATMASLLSNPSPFLSTPPSANLGGYYVILGYSPARIDPNTGLVTSSICAPLPPGYNMVYVPPTLPDYQQALYSLLTAPTIAQAMNPSSGLDTVTTTSSSVTSTSTPVVPPTPTPTPPSIFTTATPSTQQSTTVDPSTLTRTLLRKTTTTEPLIGHPMEPHTPSSTTSHPPQHVPGGAESEARMKIDDILGVTPLSEISLQDSVDSLASATIPTLGFRGQLFTGRANKRTVHTRKSTQAEPESDLDEDTKDAEYRPRRHSTRTSKRAKKGEDDRSERQRKRGENDRRIDKVDDEMNEEEAKDKIMKLVVGKMCIPGRSDPENLSKYHNIVCDTIKKVMSTVDGGDGGSTVSSQPLSTPKSRSVKMKHSSTI